MAIRCFVNTFGPVCLIGTVIGKVMGNLDRSTGFSMMMDVSAREETRKKGKKLQETDDKEFFCFYLHAFGRFSLSGISAVQTLKITVINNLFWTKLFTFFAVYYSLSSSSSSSAKNSVMTQSMNCLG